MKALSGPLWVSWIGNEGCTLRLAKAPKYELIGYHKWRWSIQTAGRWPWKSETAKECVTTHLPNGLAPKMDGVEADNRYQTAAAMLSSLSV